MDILRGDNSCLNIPSFFSYVERIEQMFVSENWDAVQNVDVIPRSPIEIIFTM